MVVFLKLISEFSKPVMSTLNPLILLVFPFLDPWVPTGNKKMFLALNY